MTNTDTGLTSPWMQDLLAQSRGHGAAPLKVGMIISPGYIPMDIMGVHSAFAVVGAELHLLWKTLDLVEGFPRYPTKPTTTFADCPVDLDVLAVGMLPPEVTADPEVIAFMATQAAKTRYIIGTCNGAVLLAAAGLLEGRRATTNANALPVLAALGVDVVPGTGVVIDGNIYTAGPATGSFDAGLLVLGQLLGEEAAKMAELLIEYVAHPPYGTGTPELAGPERAAQSSAFMQATNDAYLAGAKAALERRKVLV